MHAISLRGCLIAALTLAVIAYVLYRLAIWQGFAWGWSINW
jgi:hypothetical protein